MDEKQKAFNEFADLVKHMAADFGGYIGASIIASIEMTTDEKPLVTSCIMDYVNAITKVVEDFNKGNADYHITYYPVLVNQTDEFEDPTEEMPSFMAKMISNTIDESIEEIKATVGDSVNRNTELAIGFIHSEYVTALVGSVEAVVDHFNDTFYSLDNDALLYEFTFKTELKGATA